MGELAETSSLLNCQSKKFDSKVRILLAAPLKIDWRDDLGRIFITGDRHGNLSDIFNFCEENNTTREDILLMLGDVGINYYLKKRHNPELRKYKDIPKSTRLKEELVKLPLTLLCLQGNHESRPEFIEGYTLKEWNGGNVYWQEAYPNLLFAKDGEAYEVNGMKVFILGGAYSVDKHYRIANGLVYFPEEQMTEETRNEIRKRIESDKDYDLVLSHTCPRKYEPVEAYLSNIDQKSVNKTTENFLDESEEKIHYKRWFCGHWHVEKSVENVMFLFKTIIEISKETINDPFVSLAVFKKVD